MSQAVQSAHSWSSQDLWSLVATAGSETLPAWHHTNASKSTNAIPRSKGCGEKFSWRVSAIWLQFSSALKMTKFTSPVLDPTSRHGDSDDFNS